MLQRSHSVHPSCPIMVALCSLRCACGGNDTQAFTILTDVTAISAMSNSHQGCYVSADTIKHYAWQALANTAVSWPLQLPTTQAPELIDAA